MKTTVNKVTIETGVALQEAQALLDYYRNRSLILAQNLSDMEQELIEARASAETAQAQLAASDPKPSNQGDE